MVTIEGKTKFGKSTYRKKFKWKSSEETYCLDFWMQEEIQTKKHLMP